MMSQSADQLTMGEVARRLAHIEAKLDSRVVYRDVYDANLDADRERMKKLEESQTWAMRLLIGSFLAIGMEAVVLAIRLVPR